MGFSLSDISVQSWQTERGRAAVNKRMKHTDSLWPLQQQPTVMLQKCSAVAFWQQKQRLTVRWPQRCSCLARVSLRRDACRSPSAHCDCWKRGKKRVINSSRSPAGVSKTWGRMTEMHYSWMVDRIGQVCSTADEELWGHRIKIKDVMWRKQQLKGSLRRRWQRKSYIMGHIKVYGDNS